MTNIEAALKPVDLKVVKPLIAENAIIAPDTKVTQLGAQAILGLPNMLHNSNSVLGAHGEELRVTESLSVSSDPKKQIPLGTDTRDVKAVLSTEYTPMPKPIPDADDIPSQDP